MYPNLLDCQWMIESSHGVLECLWRDMHFASLRDVIPVPCSSMGEDGKKMFAWYVMSESIFASARRHLL